MSLIFSNDLCSAYVAEIVKSFGTLKPQSYLGRTALQKLAYFSKAIGVPMPCSFEIYNFGPYSEEVTRSVSFLLADEAIQDASGSGKYSNYKPALSAGAFSQEYLSEVNKHRPKIDSVVGAIGDQRPEVLELIATLHFVNAKQKGLTGTRPSFESVVAEFKGIKGGKFTDEAIQSWYTWLEACNLL